MFAAGVCLAVLMADPAVLGKRWFCHDTLGHLAELEDKDLLVGVTDSGEKEGQPGLSVRELEQMLQFFLGAYYSDCVVILHQLQQKYPEELCLVVPRLQEFIAREVDAQASASRRGVWSREKTLREQCAEARELSRRLHELV